MKKNRILLVNLFLIIAIIVIADFYAFATNSCYEAMRLEPKNLVHGYIRWFKSTHKILPCFNKKVQNEIFLSEKYAEENDQPQWNLFRPIENKSQDKSILIFGCSYAYGFRLGNNQTFSRELGKLLPEYSIYNRALTGTTTSQMLYQLENYKFDKEQNVKTVIYVFIPDHIMRNYNSHITMFFPYYEEYKNKIRLQEKSYKYISTPLLIWLKQIYTNKYLYKQLSYCRDKNNITHDRVLLTKKILEESYNQIKKQFGEDTNFIVFRYDFGEHSSYNWIFEELKEKNIKNIALNELTDKNFESQEYQLPNDLHPNEKAWKEFTPLFYERLKDYI